jgi:hypothetical protein
MRCDWCHKEYEPLRKRKTERHFCSGACRQAYNLAHRAEERGERQRTKLAKPTSYKVERLVRSSKKDIETVSTAVVELKAIAGELSGVAQNNQRLRPICEHISGGIVKTLEEVDL